MEPFVTGAIVAVSYVVVVSLIGALKLIRCKEEGSQSTVHTKRCTCGRLVAIARKGVRLGID
jgi:hypothetical protein